jgi:hypothetical protein
MSPVAWTTEPSTQSQVDKPVYLAQLKGFIEQGKENWVWILKKCVYGLKQASLMWRSTFHLFLVEKLGMVQVHVESCVYIRRFGDTLLMIVVYVDDFLMGCGDEAIFSQVEAELTQRFRVKRLGEMTRYLGMNFERRGNGLFVHNRDLIEDLCNRCRLSEGGDINVPWPGGFNASDQSSFDNTTVYRSVVGVISWISQCTRPDISFYVTYLAGFNNSPLRCHWEQLKKLVGYLQTTKDKGILLGADPSKHWLTAFCDASHGDPLLEGKSTTGYLFMLGGAPIAWASRKQKTISLSSSEAEYIAMSEMAIDAKYYLQVLQSFLPQVKTVLGLVDSEPARRIASGDATLRKVRHLTVRYHFVREMALSGELDLRWVTKMENVADILTKAMTNRSLFESLRGVILHE